MGSDWTSVWLQRYLAAGHKHSTTIITFLMVFLLQNTGNRTIDEMHDRLRTLEQMNRELLEELRKKNG